MPRKCGNSKMEKMPKNEKDMPMSDKPKKRKKKSSSNRKDDKWK